MPRGGYRPNSGPKKGTKYKKKTQEDIPTNNAERQPPPLPGDPIMPLDYMLRVLNDPEASSDRKDKMAALAAPFCHARAEGKAGKKHERQEAAKDAAKGKFAPMSGPKVVGIKRGE